MNPFAVTVKSDISRLMDRWSGDMLCLIDELLRRADDRLMVRCYLEDLSEALLMKPNTVMHMLKKIARQKLLAYSKTRTALTIALNEDAFRKIEREDMKISSVYKTDMTLNDVVEHISSLTETIKQINANIEQMSREIEALKHEDEELPFKALDPDAKLPVRKHAGDAGMDIHCIKDYDIAPGERVIVQTGLAVAMPEDSVLYICPRSGLAANNGLTIVNTPATIDAGFRGELKVIMLNTGSEAIHFDKGDRVAQLELLTCRFPKPVFADELPEPSDGRGASGYGSTGVK